MIERDVFFFGRFCFFGEGGDEHDGTERDESDDSRPFISVKHRCLVELCND